MIYLSADNLEIIKREMIVSYPLEGCGLLVGKVNEGQKQVIEVIPTENDWENQKQLFSEFIAHSDLRECRDSFSINPLMLLQVQKKARQDNLNIIGIYHSHPDHVAIPSAFDTQFAWPIYSYIILSINQGKVDQIRSWILNESRQFVEEELLIT